MKIQADIKTQACAADFNEDTGSRRHQGNGLRRKISTAARDEMAVGG
jgi:hypothetical protein